LAEYISSAAAPVASTVEAGVNIQAYYDSTQARTAGYGADIEVFTSAADTPTPIPYVGIFGGVTTLHTNNGQGITTRGLVFTNSHRADFVGDTPPRTVGDTLTTSGAVITSGFGYSGKTISGVGNAINHGISVEAILDGTYNATAAAGENYGVKIKVTDNGIVTTEPVSSYALHITAAISADNLTSWGIYQASDVDNIINGQLRVGGTAAPTAYLHLAAGTAGTGPLKLTAGTALDTPEAGVMNYVDSRFCVTNVATCRAVDRTSDVLLETITVANTTVKTLLWTAAMPANSLVAGNIFKFKGIGTASNTANGVLTISVEVNDNEVVAIDNTARNFSDDDVHIDAFATQRTLNNGTDGERAFHFDLCIGDDCDGLNGVATIDTEDDMTVKIYAKWDTAHASNTFSLFQAFMEYKN